MARVRATVLEPVERQPEERDKPKEATAEEAIDAALGRGDRRGALVLCSRHYGAVIGRLCMAMVGSQADAEDLTQETLLDAHDGFDGWRREGTMRAWLLTIARRKCARHIEKKARRARLRLVHDASSEPTASSAEREILLRQRAERARAALDKIRPSEREALLLRYGAGLSFQEVGLACGVDDVAARKRVSRAIAHLRETLREEGRDA
jgi:RNA polymerase sigma-70 factor (ECF subfamily)